MLVKLHNSWTIKAVKNCCYIANHVLEIVSVEVVGKTQTDPCAMSLPTTILGLSCFLLLVLCISRASSTPATAAIQPVDDPLPVAKRHIGHKYLDVRWRMLSAMSSLKLWSSRMVYYVYTPTLLLPA